MMPEVSVSAPVDVLLAAIEEDVRLLADLLPAAYEHQWQPPYQQKSRTVGSTLNPSHVSDPTGDLALNDARLRLRSAAVRAATRLLKLRKLADDLQRAHADLAAAVTAVAAAEDDRGVL